MPEPRKTTRKEFLQRILGTLPDESKNTLTDIDKSAINEVVAHITAEQHEFLRVYEQWLNHFQVFIERQKKNPNDLQNNVRLMSLSQQAAEWKIQLEEFMENETFRKTYLSIIQKVTLSIGT